MSTRANIIITDGYQNQIFYRHSDGYPEGVEETLQKFIDWVSEGKIRNNTGQAAGWLIMLGAMEYCTIPDGYKVKKIKTSYSKDFYRKIKSYGDLVDDGMAWKVGAYEPTDGVHGDIDYLYLIDLRSPSVKLIENWSNANIEKVEMELDNKVLDTIFKSVTGLLNPEFVRTAKGRVILKPT